MAQAMIRGYSLKRSVAFIDEHFDAETAAKVKEQAAEAVGVAESAKPADWCSRENSSALFRAIASVGADDEAAFSNLVACGEYISAEATNTFFRVLLKIMTPTLFAKKLPTFWDRDQRGGKFIPDVSRAGDRIITLRLVDVGDYDHIGPVTVGFFEFLWRTMGKKDVVVKQEGWTMETPRPPEIDFEVTWA